jgi:hypothetical protein
MKLLKPIMDLPTHLKMGIFGDTGSGKTFTAAQTAIGFHKYLKASKPVAFFDTERGSEFLVPLFKKQGIELFGIKSRAALDLNQTIKDAEAECSILIMDSITHVWEEFTDSYLKKSKQKFIEVWDWKPIKADWKSIFTTPFLNSKLHIIMCGREGSIYGDVEEEKQGRIVHKTVNIGKKMKAEGETGYEPNLLCQMEKIFEPGKGKGKGSYSRSCNVIKDRFTVLDSKTFTNPTFKDFLPHIELLDLNGQSTGIDLSRNSEELFTAPDRLWSERKKQVEIVLENIQSELILQGFDGSSAETKKKRTELLLEIFGTYSKTEIDSKSLEELQSSFEKLKSRRVQRVPAFQEDIPDTIFNQAVNE